GGGAGRRGLRGGPGTVVIVSGVAWVLGLGVLALSVSTAGGGSATNNAAGVNVLFGSIFGLSGRQATLAALVAAGLVLVLLLVARPLLFASLDEAVAAARRGPGRALRVGVPALGGAAAAGGPPGGRAVRLLG